MLKKELKILFSIFILFFITFATSFISAEGSEVSYCAEKTTDGFWCQNVPLDRVNTSYRYDRTSCGQTSYCSEGTCVNSKEGKCTPSTEAPCDPSRGGYWYQESQEDLAQCNLGCCVLGEEATFVERIRCSVLAAEYNIEEEFYSNVQNVFECSAMAGSSEEGACVLEMDTGRTCERTTRGGCTGDEKEFYAGFLCTAQELVTNCEMTKNTKCENGKVYFVDSCGNTANIYDSSRVTDTEYWTEIKTELESCGYGESNADSVSCGNCKYSQGSTCGAYGSVSNRKPTYGNYICGSLDCTSGTLAEDFKEKNGRYPDHGEEWCYESLEEFEEALPGQLSYLLYCYDGEVQYELCDTQRNMLCKQDSETGNAGCIYNLWGDCYFQNNTRDCLNEDFRDCKVVYGVNSLITNREYSSNFYEDGKRVVASCVPKYTPAFKFWDPEGTIVGERIEEGGTPASICSVANYRCFVPYTQEIGYFTTFWAEPTQDCVDMCKEDEEWGLFEGNTDVNQENECYNLCTPKCLNESYFGQGKNAVVSINKSWVVDHENLCNAVGDCGVSENWLQKEGYNDWRDLFFGDKIKWDDSSVGDWQ